jgi:hypothetical protein
VERRGPLRFDLHGLPSFCFIPAHPTNEERKFREEAKAPPAKWNECHVRLLSRNA